MSASLEHRRRAAELDAFLGDPRDADAYFGYARRVVDDEAEVYPEEGFARLNDWGLQHYYVPSALGGRLNDFETLASLLRIASGRDLTISIGHAVSFLGSMCIWITGTAEQQRWLADEVLSGRRISLALTEKTHGGDLLGMETDATPSGNRFRLSGEKWLVNGVGRNALVTVFARTEARGGPRGFSLFLVDKAALPSASFSVLPKNRTLGVRGADISGLCFHDATLPPTALIGAVGGGFECVLKGLQLSRLLCGSLSLGAADTGMAVTLEFARERRLYGKTVADIPQSQRLATEAWVDMLIADSLSTFALRALHLAPGQASLHSAAVKYLVPTLAERAFRKLGTLLGARYYLRQEHAGGIFQKMLRDNLLVGLFDGSTMVNLYGLSFQLRAQLTPASHSPVDWERLVSVADWRKELPPFDWSSLSLACRGRDLMMLALDEGFADYVEAAERVDGAYAAFQGPTLDVIAIAHGTLARTVRELAATAWHAGEPALFELARQYTVLAAAGSAVAQRLLNRGRLQDSLCHPAVWTIALNRISALLGAPAPVLPARVYHDAFKVLQNRFAAGSGYGLEARPTLSEFGGNRHGTSAVETVGDAAVGGTYPELVVRQDSRSARRPG